MTTEQKDSLISDDALDALSCFSDDVEKLVYRIAEESARERDARADAVVVRVEDVKKAARTVRELLERAVSQDVLRRAVSDGMNCLDSKYAD